MQRKWYRRGRQLLDEIKSTHVSEQQLAVWYLGQCGFAFRNKATVYIDPVLNDLLDADGNTKRYYPIPFEPASVQADFVVCTHNHADHLAVKTLQGIAQGDTHTQFIIPASHRAVLAQAGIPQSRILPIHDGETIFLPDFTVSAISAAHPVHQKDTACCFHLKMGEIHITHLGDTYLTSQLLSDLQRIPLTHLFFPPINGSDYFRTQRNCIGNLNMLEAARLADMLHADMTIPTHFDMVHGNTADPLQFARELWNINPAAKWHIPALGERFIYHL